ncbi:hypothetical protein M3Y98_00408200 [Aphelenchoides besseyi]|nr:hypothetical protein M3Y98_00408200 [Aphelenchoides besseyi]KAI6202010.1 hypothetical protein M3Y96_00903000 [Aphelenchoides besseyi]
MRLIFVLGVVSVFAFEIVQADDASRTSCINKFLKYFSTFFAATQIGGYADVGMSQVLVHANGSKIVDAVTDAVMNNLTSSQYSQSSTLMVSAAQKFGSYEKINSTIQKCVKGAGPTLLKLYSKITNKINKANGNSAKMAVGYKFADKKFTLKLSKKLVKKCKSKLSDDEWQKGVSLLKNYVKFETLGVKL